MTAQGYFAYVNKISFAYPEQSVHKDVTAVEEGDLVATSWSGPGGKMGKMGACFEREISNLCRTPPLVVNNDHFLKIKAPNLNQY